jgi:hypothetical protein
VQTAPQPLAASHIFLQEKACHILLLKKHVFSEHAEKYILKRRGANRKKKVSDFILRIRRGRLTRKDIA